MSRRRMIVVRSLGEVDGFLASAIQGAESSRPTTIRDVLSGRVAEVIGRAILARDRRESVAAVQPGFAATVEAAEGSTAL